MESLREMAVGIIQESLDFLFENKSIHNDNNTNSNNVGSVKMDEGIENVTGSCPSLSSIIALVVSSLGRRLGSSGGVGEGVVVGAMGSKESSEEIRLLGMILLEKNIIHRLNNNNTYDSGEILFALCEEIVGVIVTGMKDNYHEVKKAASRCAAEASKSGMFLGRSHCRSNECSSMNSNNDNKSQLATQVIRTCVMSVLSHQHHRVRQAGLKALEQLILCGGHSNDRRTSNNTSGSSCIASVVRDDLIPSLFLLIQDRQPIVRRSLMCIVSIWMKSDIILKYDNGDNNDNDDDMNIDNICKDHSTESFQLLLPILISGLTDETKDVVEETERNVKEVGNAWAMACGTNINGNHVQEMVCCTLCSLLPPVIKGLKEWTVTLRHLYARQLKATLMLVGDAITGNAEYNSNGHRKSHLEDVLQALSIAVGDENQEVAEMCISCAHQISRSCSPEHWVGIIVASIDDCMGVRAGVYNSKTNESHKKQDSGIGGIRINGSKSVDDSSSVALSGSITYKTSVLTLLAALLFGTRDNNDNTENKFVIQEDDMNAIATALSSHEMRAVNDASFRLQLLVVMQNLTKIKHEGSPSDSEETSRSLFVIMLHLTSKENNGEMIAKEAKAIIELIAKDADEGTTATSNIDEMVSNLYAKHASNVLTDIISSDKEWISTSPEFQIFKQLLMGCPSVALRDILPRAMPTMYTCASENRDANLRIAILKLIDSLAETKENNVAFLDVVSRSVMELAMLCAIWRAGKTAAAIRYSSVILMGTMIRRGFCNQDMLSGMLKQSDADEHCKSNNSNEQASSKTKPCILPTVITCMDEDFYADTRRASCHLCEQLLLIAGQQSLTDEQRRQLYPALLKRLDDSSDDVRIAACSVLSAFFSTLSSDYDDTNTGYLLKGMLLHMDDANESVQEAVCQAAFMAKKVKRAAVVAAVEEAKLRHRSSKYCDRVLAA